MAKFVVAAPPIPGEAGPLITVACGLAGRGHEVVFLTGHAMRAAVEDAGLPSVALSGAADSDR
jgi:UDP:flavonoid glycosyltransferase YjiC (YdhE family)